MNETRSSFFARVLIEADQAARLAARSSAHPRLHAAYYERGATNARVIFAFHTHTWGAETDRVHLRFLFDFNPPLGHGLSTEQQAAIRFLFPLEYLYRCSLLLFCLLFNL